MEQAYRMTARSKTKNKKAPRQRAKADDESDESQRRTPFPIVGIGASAGGLEAFEMLFKRIAPDSGMAFVLVTHLDPSHASGMSTILQRITPMPVLEAEDGMAVKANHVYLIPPNRYMTISEGALRITVPDEPHGQRMAIDFFLRSLAQDQGENAICAILSGGGSDGTYGLRAVHGAGGVSFVQDPSTAKHDSMPMSAIRSGLATFVVPMDRMADELMAYSNDILGGAATSTPPIRAPSGRTDLDELLTLLRDRTGHDFSMYKTKMILRRIQRRMNLQGIDTKDAYIQRLKKHPEEVKTLIGDLLINVTSFFRDPDAFDVLAKEVLPRLLDGKPEGYAFRVWVVGCATGEEAYSVAIVLKEYMEAVGRNFNVKVYATDVNIESVATARRGLYLSNVAIDVTADRLRRFFVREEAGYRIRKDVRGMILFAPQDILKDPPFTKLDLISCRNLLIYLEPETQRRLIMTLHYASKLGGVLFLGPSEGIGGLTKHLDPINKRWKFYQTKEVVTPARTIPPYTLPWVAPKQALQTGAQDIVSKEPSIAELTKAALLKSFAPPAVLTDESGEIIYVYGDTGRYLRPAPGHANLRVTDMACEGLQFELRKAIKDVISKKKPVVKKNLKARMKDRTETVDITVRPMNEREGGSRMLMITFQNVQQPPPVKSVSTRRSDSPELKRHIEELEQELSQAQINLQDTVERLQAYNEELMSTNEEYMSTNEELQSTNEELQTSQEELQSVNEELAMVNAELEATNENLKTTQSDMKNLLDNTFIGTIFLDERLTIKWFNQGARNAFRIAASDTGRPLADIKSTLMSEDIISDAQSVLKSLKPIDKEVETIEGQWLLARIRPYRALDDSVGGVVLTFTDVTDLRLAKELSEESRSYAESIVNTVSESLIVLDGDLRIISVNDSYCRTFETTAEEIVGSPIYEIADGYWDIPELRELLENILPQHATFDGLEVEIETPTVGRKRMVLNSRRIMEKSGVAQHILLAVEDVTEKKLMKQVLAETNRKLQLMTDVTRHDIQGLLTIVNGNLELAQMEGDPKAARRFTDSAIEATHKMGAMIQFTKEYQQVGCEKPVWQNVRLVLTNTVVEAPMQGIRIENNLPDIEVFADPLLPKLFYNLIHNSVIHGERTTIIRFTSEMIDSDLRITCDDDGVGIPAEEKERIFDRGHGKGTGLGLFYAREICSITGLGLNECVRKGDGARFVISIPKGKWRRVNPA
ncbi:MAG: PAS domain-containing protein [Thermoplasmata archaeon]|nr:PAS domain-containing protein [Thermoplasmata archaeon]